MIADNYEIQLKENKIELLGYEQLVKQLDQLGEYLLSIEVTQDNIKENKKLVARVRKACDQLNKERVAFKKSYLEPLTTLEEQVKAIDKKAAEYEAVVRTQIREIEEQEREDKKNEIKEIFSKRSRTYGNSELYPFEDFLEQKYLNKSYSMTKVENEMINWFESRENDINALISYSESIPQDKETVITQYLLLQDVAATISHFTAENTKKEQVKKAVEDKPKKVKKPTPKTTFLIRFNEDDKERVTQLLDISKIEYEVV